MPSKTLYVDGNAGVLMIGDYGVSTNAVSNPDAYLDNLNFHSGYNYVQFYSTTSVSSITFPAVPRNVYTWNDASKGGCF